MTTMLVEMNGNPIVTENKYINTINSCTLVEAHNIILNIIEIDLLMFTTNYIHSFGNDKHIPYSIYEAYIKDTIRLVDIDDICKRTTDSWSYLKYILNSSMRKFLLMNEIIINDNYFSHFSTSLISTYEKIDTFLITTKIKRTL